MWIDIADQDVTLIMTVSQLKVVERMEHVHVLKDISKLHLDAKTLMSAKEVMFVQLRCVAKTNQEVTLVNVLLERLAMPFVDVHLQMNVEMTYNVPII